MHTNWFTARRTHELSNSASYKLHSMMKSAEVMFISVEAYTSFWCARARSTRNFQAQPVNASKLWDIINVGMCIQYILRYITTTYSIIDQDECCQFGNPVAFYHISVISNQGASAKKTYTYFNYVKSSLKRYA